MLQDSILNLTEIASDITAVLADRNDALTLNQALQGQLAQVQKDLADALTKNQTGSKYTPTVNPHLSLKDILNCLKHAHVMPWFGQSSHADVGYSSASFDTINWQLDQLIAKGIDGVNVLFSGRSKDFNTTAASRFLTAAAARGLLTSIMIDHEADVPAADFKWAIDNLMSSGSQWVRNGKRVITVFDDPTAAQLAFIPDDVAILYRNSSGFSKPRSAGCYSWPAPGNEASYCANFYQKTASAAGKLIVPHVSPGFTGASWNQSATFKPTPWRYGAEWLDSIKRVIDSKTNPTDLLIATWNDLEEGTGIERSPLL